MVGRRPRLARRGRCNFAHWVHHFFLPLHKSQNSIAGRNTTTSCVVLARHASLCLLSLALLQHHETALQFYRLPREPSEFTCRFLRYLSTKGKPTEFSSFISLPLSFTLSLSLSEQRSRDAKLSPRTSVVCSERTRTEAACRSEPRLARLVSPYRYSAVLH